MNKKELWVNLTNYHFDNLVPTHIWDEIVAKFGGQNPSVNAFADKLCRKFNWEKKFALKAIWEYKKFVYLGVISKYGVTPSKVIDKVWHEHLLFSSGYRKFCNDVIQYEFDHHPELVSITSQTEAFESQYYYTIELYKKEFGAEPPSEIWDATKFNRYYFTTQGKIETQKPKNDYSFDFEPDTLSSMFSNVIDTFGGGESNGGGAGGSWDNSSHSHDSSSHDSSSSDSSSSDSSSSCSSSCGSSCGGGCGG